MKGDFLGISLFLAFLALLAALAWATRNPDSAVVRAAEELPVIGSLAEGFRARYLAAEQAQVPHQDAPEAGRSAEGTSPAAVDHERRIVVEAPQPVWVLEGTPVYSGPELSATVFEHTAEIERLPVVQRRGDWFQVRWGSVYGWVHLPDYAVDEGPLLGSDAARPLPLPGRAADTALVRSAGELLGRTSGAGSDSVGGYRLLGELEEPLLRRLSAVADRVETAYTERYGVVPIDQPRETVIVFPEKRELREFQSLFERLEGLPAEGLAGRGIVAVYHGGRVQDEVLFTLIHELAHLLNRRALGPALPPWLEEGIAGDLAAGFVSHTGEMLPERLGGGYRNRGPVRIWWGGQNLALQVRGAATAGELVELQDLLAKDWHEFVARGERLYYPQSALWVRFLLAEEDLRAGFRAYLKGISIGESVGTEELLERVGGSWPVLQSRYVDWIDEQTDPLEALAFSARR